MHSLKVIDTFHQDIVHDISFDWYSKRLATCSSDQKVKIWDKQPNGQWLQTCEFKAHDAPIWKVKWAHPDFGSILATCSYDKMVKIWEERKIQEYDKEKDKNVIRSTWIKRTHKQLESKESIEDIKFGPKHLGLIIATASSEGSFRIYESVDLMNLQNWNKTADVMVTQLGLNSISWSKNQFEQPMMVVGCKDIQTSFQKNFMKYDGKTIIEQDEKESSYLKIYRKNDQNEGWQLFANLPETISNSQQSYHKSACNDASWANINGRSFDLISSCGKDGVFVWNLRIKGNDIQLLKVQSLEKETQKITWRVSWNMMATSLATSDDQNVISIWKNNGTQNWQCVNTIKVYFQLIVRVKKIEKYEFFYKYLFQNIFDNIIILIKNNFFSIFDTISSIIQTFILQQIIK